MNREYCGDSRCTVVPGIEGEVKGRTVVGGGGAVQSSKTRARARTGTQEQQKNDKRQHKWRKNDGGQVAAFVVLEWSTN